MTLAMGTRLGRYEIRSKIGAGGMGEVYLAEDTQLGRRVAIKLLPPDATSDEHAKKRLVREARAAATLDHPNICAIHEVGEEDGRSFIVMHHVEGETLDARIKRKPLDLKESLDIASQVANALSEAHVHGIIHRDIKPSNIIVTSRGQAKVMDFGLAKAMPSIGGVDTEADTQTLLTTPGTVIGTVPYMSPEQVRGEQIDARSDIFSFGVVLYEMLSGRQPFASESGAATISAILTSEAPPLARYAPDVPDELQRIAQKCLAKDRALRYQSARELALDLRALERLSGSTIAASEQMPHQTRNFRRFAFAALALVSLAAGVVGLIAYWHTKSTEAAIDSIAVLPFANTNGDPNTEYLSDGITESIISSLSQLPQLRVMARSTVFSYKGKDVDPRKVGHDLGVRAVLMGRLIQQGDNLTIRTELVNVADGTELWGQQYKRKLADVFAVQEEMAKEISEKLRLKLTSTEQQQLAKRPTENLKAFQYYMQGRSYAQRRTREDLLTAIQYEEKALQEDPNYALAYTGLAEAYSNLGNRAYIAPIEGRQKAEEAARKALALDENLPEAHLALAQPNVQFVPYNFSLADRELRRAIELSPSLATAHQYFGISLARRGRLDEALEEFQKARELDPLSSAIARTAAIPYYLKRDYARALELLRQANELGPPISQPWEIGPYIQSGSFNEALAELEQAKRERKNDPILIGSTGMVYAAQGKRAEALQIIKELEAMSGPSLDQAHPIAKIYAALNEKELAFSWLERGLAAGAIGSFLKDEPVWDPIRSDPRFVDLLRRMGL